MQLFKKTYDGESLYDLDRDISEAFEEESNQILKGAYVPLGEDGVSVLRGKFTVTIEWDISG